jgi:hypothetical protein
MARPPRLPFTLKTPLRTAAKPWNARGPGMGRWRLHGRQPLTEPFGVLPGTGSGAASGGGPAE